MNTKQLLTCTAISKILEITNYNLDFHAERNSPIELIHLKPFAHRNTVVKY